MNPSTSLRCSLALGTLVLLSACGGGGSSAPPVDPPPPPPPPPQVGQLLDVQPLGDISRRDIADAIADSNRIPTSLAPRYGVTTYRLSYLTQDKDGALVRASGLVALPVRPAGATPSAVLSYQHATTFENAYAPSVNLAPAEPPLVLASLGYIVVASDYVGFADSQGLDHPYLQADATARAVLDMLTAAQRWRSDCSSSGGSLTVVVMASSTMRRWSFSSPFSLWTAEISMPQLSWPIIFRGGRLTMATRVLPTSSSGL